MRKGLSAMEGSFLYLKRIKPTFPAYTIKTKPVTGYQVKYLSFIVNRYRGGELGDEIVEVFSGTAKGRDFLL